MFVLWWSCRFIYFWLSVLICSQHAELWKAEEAAVDSQSFWEHLTYFFLLEFNGALRRWQRESRKVGSTSTLTLFTYTYIHTELGSDPVSPNIRLSDWGRSERLAGILFMQCKGRNTHKEMGEEGDDRARNNDCCNIWTETRHTRAMFWLPSWDLGSCLGYIFQRTQGLRRIKWAAVYIFLTSH